MLLTPTKVDLTQSPFQGQFNNDTRTKNFLPDGKNTVYALLLLDLQHTPLNASHHVIENIKQKISVDEKSALIMKSSKIDWLVYSQLVLTSCSCFDRINGISEQEIKLTDFGHVREHNDFSMAKCVTYAQKQLPATQTSFVSDVASPGLPNPCDGFYFPTQQQLRELSLLAARIEFDDTIIVNTSRKLTSMTDWCLPCLPEPSYINITLNLMVDGRMQAYQRRHDNYPQPWKISPTFQQVSSNLTTCITMNELKTYVRGGNIQNEVIRELEIITSNKPLASITPEDIEELRSRIKLLQRQRNTEIEAAAAGAIIGAAAGAAITAGKEVASAYWDKLATGVSAAEDITGILKDIFDIIDSVSDLADNLPDCPDCPECPDTENVKTTPATTTSTEKTTTSLATTTAYTTTSTTTSQQITTASTDSTTTTTPEEERYQKSGNDDHRCFLTLREFADQLKVLPLEPCDENSNDFILLSDLMEPFDRDLYGKGFGTCNQLDLVFSRALGRYIDCEDLDDVRAEVTGLYICPKHLSQYGTEFTKWTQYFKRRKTEGDKRTYFCSIEGLPGHPGLVIGRRFLQKDEAAAIAVKQQDKHFLLGVPICNRHKTIFSGWNAELQIENKNYFIAPYSQESLPFKPQITKRSSTPQAYCSSQSSKSSSQNTEITLSQNTELTDSLPESIGSGSSAGFQPPPPKRAKEMMDDEKQKLQIQSDFRKLAEKLQISRFHCTDSFSALDKHTKMDRARAAQQFIQMLYSKCMAEDTTIELQKLVSRRMADIYEVGLYPEAFEEIVAKTMSIRDRSTNRQERRALLSLLTSVVSYASSLQYVPGLTRYEYTASRAWSMLYSGENEISYKPDITINRVPKASLQYLVNFMCDPVVMTELPFGRSKIKFSSGITEEIPSTVRNMNNRRFYQLYKMYMEEQDMKEYLLSVSTVNRALAFCTAKKAKIESGLDYITSAGHDAYDMLESVLNEIRTRGLASSSTVKELITTANKCRVYLDGEYQLKLKDDSRIADHNMKYALSDPKKLSFSSFDKQSPVNEQIDLCCNMCDACKSVEHQIRQLVLEVKPEDPIDADEWLWLTNNAITDIHDWKAHQLRSFFSHKSLKLITQNMGNTDVLCVMDFAMKYLPVEYRENQRNWYGKTGISWHITYCTKKDADDNDEYIRHAYIHILESGKQDCESVIAIVNHTLSKISQHQPSARRLHLRSDNAACYHGSQLIATLPLLSDNKHGIKIASYSFSEVQSGKGPCDRFVIFIHLQS